MMPLPEDTNLRQFLLFAFALIVPCFAIWTLLSGPIAMPVVGLADMILKAWFPTVVDGLLLQGSDTLLMTQFIRTEIWPKRGCKIPLCISPLPYQEITTAQLARSSDDQIRIWHARRIQILADQIFSNIFGVSAILDHLFDGKNDLITAAIIKSHIEYQAIIILR